MVAYGKMKTNLTNGWDLQDSISVVAYGRIKSTKPMDGTYK